MLSSLSHVRSSIGVRAARFQTIPFKKKITLSKVNSTPVFFYSTIARFVYCAAVTQSDVMFPAFSLDWARISVTVLRFLERFMR